MLLCLAQIYFFSDSEQQVGWRASWMAGLPVAVSMWNWLRYLMCKKSNCIVFWWLASWRMVVRLSTEWLINWFRKVSYRFFHVGRRNSLVEQLYIVDQNTLLYLFFLFCWQAFWAAADCLRSICSLHKYIQLDVTLVAGWFAECKLAARWLADDQPRNIVL